MVIQVQLNSGNTMFVISIIYLIFNTITSAASVIFSLVGAGLIFEVWQSLLLLAEYAIILALTSKLIKGALKNALMLCSVPIVGGTLAPLLFGTELSTHAHAAYNFGFIAVGVILLLAQIDIIWVKLYAAIKILLSILMVLTLFGEIEHTIKSIGLLFLIIFVSDICMVLIASNSKIKRVLVNVHG